MNLCGGVSVFLDARKVDGIGCRRARLPHHCRRSLPTDYAFSLASVVAA